MVNSVTTTMMNVKFALAGGSAARRVAFRRAVLPIPGTTPVSVVLACDEISCRALGAKLFCVKPGEVDVGMIEDTLRELANITAGQVKRAMALDQALGLPRILVGTETWSSSIAGSQLVHLRAETADIEIEVQIAKHPKGS
jgi:CheY-specific phosphatase CheX